MRISVLRFTADYQMVTEAFKDMLKDHVVTERTEDGKSIVEIEGNFSHFVLEDMEMWENHIKIEIRDNRIQDDTDNEARSIFARAEPGFAEVLFSPTIAYVYKRVETRTRTITIIETLEDDAVVKKDEKTEVSEPTYTWKDITREFGRKVRADRIPA